MFQATLMQASVNVSRLATYMPYLQAGSMYSITSFDSVFDFGLIRGPLSRSRFGYAILLSRSFLCTFVCVVPIMCIFSLVAEFVNVLRTKTKPCFDVFFLLLGSCLLPCMLLLVLMRDQILSIIFLKFEGWSMYLHLEVTSLDFGKRWQAQGYGQDKLTLMQATTSEYLQHLSNAGSMYSVTGFEAKEEVVAGTMHHLPLEIIEAGKELYEEKLWVKPWLNFNELQELKLAITMHLDGGKFQEMVKKCNMFPDHAVYFFLRESLFSFCQGFTKK
ncbi:unnamed protein product, partial [Brassica oleracea]